LEVAYQPEVPIPKSNDASIAFVWYIPKDLVVSFQVSNATSRALLTAATVQYFVRNDDSIK